MIIVTLDSVTPRFTQTVELDGVSFTFAFEWNDRNEQWSFSLYDAAGVGLVHGVSLVVGIPLLNRFPTIAGLPAGGLEAIDTSDLSADPGFEDLGSRVQVLYWPVAEIPSEFKR